MRAALLHLKRSDPILRAIIEKVGPFRLEKREPSFETLVRSIVYQQLSGKAAATIMGRLKAHVGSRFTPGALLRLPVEELRALGLSNQKAAYVHDLAERTRKREIRFQHLLDLPDEEIIEILTQVKGVGVWTVQMFLIFALERPNILPVGDLGVRNAIQRAYGLEALPTPDEIRQIAECWHPYCSIASWYLWRSLDGPAQI